ncbi:MAG: FTR1 family iron permease [Chloroflexota bacterium]
MITGFILALREGLESALIVGIVLGALRHMGKVNWARAVWGGVISAGVVSLIGAAALYRVGIQLEGKAEEIFEGMTMLLAAGVLTWMIFWMKRQAVYLRRDLEKEVERAATSTSVRALFLLAFVAVVREGLELSLFLTAAAFSGNGLFTWLGGLMGLICAVILGWLFFRTTVKLSLKRFFQFTSILLLFFAAGLVGHGIHELNEAGWIPALVEPVWNVNSILDEKSPLGMLLTSLFGYNGNPSLSEAVGYLSYFIIIGFAIWKKPPRRIAIQNTA